MSWQAALLQAMQVTEQRAQRNLEDSRRTRSHSHDKDNNNGINAHHGCKYRTKYEEEMEISSTAERETTFGEFQREIKRLRWPC